MSSTGPSSNGPSSQGPDTQSPHALTPEWRARLRRALKWSMGLAVVTGGWIVAFNIGFIDEFLYGSGALLISVPLFILSLPLGFLLRLDNMFVEAAGDWTQGQKLALLLLATVVNLFLVSIAIGFYRDLKRKLGIKDVVKPPKRSKKAKKAKSE